MLSRASLQPAPALLPLLATAWLSAVLAGFLAAAGRGPWALVAVAGLGLVALGAWLPLPLIRALALAALLLVPDAPSGFSWGLQVRWSHGLTWSNFIVPALVLPLALGVWLSGRPLMPPQWGRLPRRWLLLLCWCLLTLTLPLSAGLLSVADLATLLAHLVKLALFVLLGVMIAGDDIGHQVWLSRLLIFGIAINALAGLAQFVGLLAVFSPLARVTTGGLPQSATPAAFMSELSVLVHAGGWQSIQNLLAQLQAGTFARATGLFYDANMYGVLAAWALLWLLTTRPSRCGNRSERGAPAVRWAWWGLTLLVAANVVAAGSRAGYAALGTGCAVLLLHRRWRPVAEAALLFVLLAALFPLQSWHRLQSAAATLQRAVSHRTVTDRNAADAGTAQRLDSLQAAWSEILAHPLFGIGFGRALYLGVPNRDAGPVRSAAVPTFNGAQDMAVTVLAETGPIGLALFLAAILPPLGALRRRPSEAQLALLAGYAGLLAACFSIEALWNTRLLALVVVLTSIAAAAGGEPQAAGGATP